MNRNNKLGWLFATPYLILAVLFFGIPLLWAFYLSVTNWNLISSSYDIVWFENYINLFKSSEILKALINTFKYALYVIPLTLLFSFSYAYVIFKLPRKIKPFFTIAFFLPYLTSGVATSILVKGFLSFDSPLSTFFRETFNVEWDLRTNANFAIAVISLMIIWKMSSYYFLFFLTSLESMPSELGEASMLDGSVGVNKLFKVTIPNLYPAIFTVVSLSVGLTYGIFTEPYMLTSGGPDFATTTWQLSIYQHAFVNFESGYAASIAIVNSIFVFANIYIVQKLIRLWGVKYANV